MTGTQFDLSYRLRPDFGAARFAALCQTVLDSLVFDEDARLELMLERNDGERTTVELTAAELPRHLPESVWPELHQVQVANQWIKGMNVKISLVRRTDHQQVALKGETPNPERRPMLEQRVAAQLGQAGCEPSEQEQERERMFGSMLMTEEIVEATRQAFLAGRFAEALAAAGLRLRRRLEHLLRQDPLTPGSVAALFAQDPPRILLPNLAGLRLKQELEGLGQLCAGALRLQVDAPAQVLKALVLIGLLLERLENAVANPAVLRKKGAARSTRKKPAAPRAAAAKRKRKAAVKKK